MPKCKACGGKGKSSRGSKCIPCKGTGQQQESDMWNWKWKSSNKVGKTPVKKRSKRK